MATDQARLAVDTRAFPLLIYDPRKGDTLRERLTLQGNPAVNDDWWTNPKTSEVVDFIDFARSEGRFGKHFDKDGNPSETLLRAKEDRLENWHLLQELAGVRGGKPTAKAPAKPPAVAKPAAPVAAKNGSSQTNGSGLLEIGAKIKYRDRQGDRWVTGVVESIDPPVLSLDDDTEIRTSPEILAAGMAEGIIVRQ